MHVPLNIRKSISVSSFKCHLKTFILLPLFNLCHLPPVTARASDSAYWSDFLCALQIYMCMYVCVEDIVELLYVSLITVCFTATTTVDFRRNSFIEWDFQDNFYAGLDKHGAHRTDLQLMFRTRQLGTSLLWKAQNAQKSEYLVLEVSFSYSLVK